MDGVMDGVMDPFHVSNYGVRMLSQANAGHAKPSGALQYTIRLRNAH